MTAPIGVFDSGVGGLTVLKELRRRLPSENYLYLGDTARVPYGTKGSATVQRFAREAAQFMAAQGVKRMVVACNTATAYALETVREVLDVPVHGVIEPGVRAALKVTSGRVGVICTPATEASGKYHDRLLELRPSLEVFTTACPLFVPLAEEGWDTGEIPLAVAKRYLAELHEKGVDSLILGCTHYPVLKGVIGEAMGPKVILVDSAVELAEAVAADLAAAGDAEPAGSSGYLRLLVSDVPQRFAQLSQRFLEHEVDEVEVVDLEHPESHGTTTGGRS